MSHDSKGLTEVSWSVCNWGSVLRFDLSCEDVCTSPNLFDRVFVECRAIWRVLPRFHGVSCGLGFDAKRLAQPQIRLIEVIVDCHM